MYRVLIIIPDVTVINKLRSLKIWGEASGFEITSAVFEPYDDVNKLNSYELIIAESTIALALLRNLKKHRLRIALYNETKDFEVARQGMILGAYDIITEPFETTQLIAMLNRAESELSRKEVGDILNADKLTAYFDGRDKGFYNFLKETLRSIRSSSESDEKAAERIRILYERVWEDISERYPWCELYINEAMYRIDENTYISSDVQTARIMTLFSEFCELYPAHNEQLECVINEILNYPESDLRQKTLSANLHINSSYLSTVFLAQTGIRFVDYVNIVKLKRAAWLLLNTQLNVIEIARRLDFNDNSYFSKLFKTKYGVIPSIFRLSPDCDFQI